MRAIILNKPGVLTPGYFPSDPSGRLEQKPIRAASNNRPVRDGVIIDRYFSAGLKVLMKTIITALAILLLATPASAEIKTYTQTVKQAFGGSQSPDNARIAAIARAKRECLEQAGTYLETLSVVKQGQLDKDKILALAAGVLKTKIISEKRYATEDAFGITVTAEVEVDTAVLDKRVEKFLEDKTLLTKYQESQDREKELLAKIKDLEAQNQKLQALETKARKQEKKELEQEFQAAAQGLSAVEWTQKAEGLWMDGQYSNPGQALEYLGQAISLDPNYAPAYNNRGVARLDLDQTQKAIEDFDQAIRLNPDNAMAYSNRGVAYKDLGQYQRAIKDLDEAIRLDPDNPKPYTNRGVAYKNLGQYPQAVKDYDQAVRLDPNDAKTHSNLGLAYYASGKYQKAIENFNQAVRLDPNDPGTYNNRGTALYKSGQRQKAVQDYNHALSLDPNYSPAYNNRGYAYIMEGEFELGCKNLERACELGNCGTLEWARKKGYCR